MQATDVMRGFEILLALIWDDLHNSLMYSPPVTKGKDPSVMLIKNLCTTPHHITHHIIWMCVHEFPFIAVHNISS